MVAMYEKYLCTHFKLKQEGPFRKKKQKTQKDKNTEDDCRWAILPSWISSRIRNQVKTVRFNNFLRLTC